MIALFEPSGTHIHKGVLQVRVDLYPQVEDRTSLMHYVDHFDRSPTAEEIADSYLLSLIPTHKEMNPCLCHFISVPETVSDLRGYIHQTFDYATLATLDNVLTLPNSAHYVSPLMQSKRFHAVPVKTADEVDLIASVNKRFAGSNPTQLVYGYAIDIKPQSIDMGDGATDRGWEWGQNLTIYSYGNPANATGTVDTAELFFNIFVNPATGVEIATADLNTGTDTINSTTDNFSIGNVAAGSKQTISISPTIDVNNGNHAGVFFTTGYIDADLNTGLTDCGYISGDYIPATAQALTYQASRDISIYFTGTEPSVGGRGWAQK